MDKYKWNINNLLIEYFLALDKNDRKSIRDIINTYYSNSIYNDDINDDILFNIIKRISNYEYLDTSKTILHNDHLTNNSIMKYVLLNINKTNNPNLISNVYKIISYKNSHVYFYYKKRKKNTIRNYDETTRITTSKTYYNNFDNSPYIFINKSNTLNDILHLSSELYKSNSYLNNIHNNTIIKDTDKYLGYLIESIYQYECISPGEILRIYKYYINELLYDAKNNINISKIISFLIALDIVNMNISSNDMINLSTSILKNSNSNIIDLINNYNISFIDDNLDNFNRLYNEVSKIK